MCIVCTIHVWCAFCHTIIKGYTYLLTYESWSFQRAATCYIGKEILRKFHNMLSRYCQNDVFQYGVSLTSWI